MYRFVPTTLLSIFTSAFLSSALFAANTFDNGSTNTLNAASEDVVVVNGAGDATTTLTIGEGALVSAVPEQDPPLADEGRAIGLFGRSILNFEAGEAAGTLQVNDTATANISGGQIGEDLEVNGGTVVLSGTGYIDDDVFVNAGSFQMSGGGTVNDQFFAVGTSVIDLAANAGPINDDLFIQDSAVLTMAGASLGDELFVQGMASATITGGYIDDDLNANDQAVINVSFVEVDDSVDTSDMGVVNFSDGIVNGGFEAVGTSVINISGGTFENILSDGEVVLAAGGTINISGGTFGTAGVDDGGSIGSSLGGTLKITGGEVAGVDEGTAPTAVVKAVLNGTTELSGVEFGALVLEAGNNGTLIADDFIATSVTATSLGSGKVVIEGGEADSLSIASELNGGVELTGGAFGEITASLVTESALTIIGSAFSYNDIPLADVDAQFNDPDAFIEQTGELRLVAGKLDGILADGTPFSMTFSREFIPAPGARLFLQPVPEPSSVLLAAFPIALIGLLRRRRKQS